MKSELIKEGLKKGEYDDLLKELYGSDEDTLSAQKERYLNAVCEFEKVYGENRDISVYSAPGRTEICGNHTDHNNGIVMAASITMDCLCIASKNEENKIKTFSKGYCEIPEVDLDKLKAQISDEQTTKGIIKGLCAYMTKAKGKCGGLDLYIDSNVLTGSGLSSSAAFEVSIATALNWEYYGGEFSPVEIAKISQKSENEYFGKPCGVMDQTVSSVGGTICMDFRDLSDITYEKINLDLNKFGYVLCAVDCGAAHDDLTDEYASIPKDMKDIANIFMKQGLRELDKESFINHIPFLRQTFGDRAVLRAMHFYMECERVTQLCQAVKNEDRSMFSQKICESGHSSYEYLQNAYVASDVKNQPMSCALAFAQCFLQDINGAWRLQGGGFAGAIQCFVPKDYIYRFVKYMESLLGENCCTVLNIRNCGAVKVI